MLSSFFLFKYEKQLNYKIYFFRVNFLHSSNRLIDVDKNKKGSYTMHSQLEQLFTNYVRDNKNQLYILAFSYVKNEQDALDVVQDSIQKGWMALDTLEEQHQIKSWLYKIVVRTAIDFLRKMKRIQVTDEDTLIYLCEEQHDAYRNLDLENALETLPLSLKQIIILRFFEDLKLEDVATIVDIPLSTAKSRLYKALKLLKIEMKDEEKLHHG